MNKLREELKKLAYADGHLNLSVVQDFIEKNYIIKEGLLKDVKDHQDTAEDGKTLGFWDQVSYWLNLKLNEIHTNN